MATKKKKQEVRIDPVDSKDLTDAIMGMLNEYPDLAGGERFAFARLDETGGLAMYPGTGAVIEEEHRSVTGKVRQVCRYPFILLSKAGGLSEERRRGAKEWLDALARWLERRKDMPALTGCRTLLGFSILSPGYLYDVDESKTETWAVELAARYENIYQK